MKKLRLIKPWQLRIIRQRLCSERKVGIESYFPIVPCFGPVAADNNLMISDNINSRFTGFCNERIVYTVKAPVSDIIFAPANIR